MERATRDTKGEFKRRSRRGENLAYRWLLLAAFVTAARALGDASMRRTESPRRFMVCPIAQQRRAFFYFLSHVTHT